MNKSKESAEGVRSGTWTGEEDEVLKELVKEHGRHKWAAIGAIVGRSKMSCKRRWIRYLDPNVQRGPFTAAEDDVIIKGNAKGRNQWAIIAQQLPWHTTDEIKNRWASITMETNQVVAYWSAGASKSYSGVKQMRCDVAEIEGLERTLTLFPLGVRPVAVEEKDERVDDMADGEGPETTLTLRLVAVEEKDERVDDMTDGEGPETTCLAEKDKRVDDVTDEGKFTLPMMSETKKRSKRELGSRFIYQMSRRKLKIG